MIVILNYGVGNLGSIRNMLKRTGVNTIISSKSADIRAADGLILPGVGAFDNGMLCIKKYIAPLVKKVFEEQTPILGICLGMQMLTNKSEEGQLPGLGWINAETVRFNAPNTSIKIPHMGWNTVKIKRKDSIFKDMLVDPRFYFVHSYHVICNNDNNTLSTTHHGYNFASAIQKGNVFGVQFHPEKSHKFGMKILENFVEVTKC